jgi:hypothetical protein
VGGANPGDLRVRVGDETIAVPLSRRDLAATLLIRCATVRAADGVARCIVSGPDRQVVVAPDALLTLETPNGPVLFQMVSARAPKAASGQSR